MSILVNNVFSSDHDDRSVQLRLGSRLSNHGCATCFFSKRFVDAAYVTFRVPSSQPPNHPCAAAHLHLAVALTYNNKAIVEADGCYFNLFHYVDVVVAVLVGNHTAALARIARLLAANGFIVPGLESMKPKAYATFCGQRFGRMTDDDNVICDESFNMMSDFVDSIKTKKFGIHKLRLMLVTLCALATPEQVASLRRHFPRTTNTVGLANSISPPSMEELLKVAEYVDDNGMCDAYVTRDTPLFCITGGLSGWCVLAQIDSQSDTDNRLRIVGVLSCGISKEMRAAGELECEVAAMRSAYKKCGYLMCQTTTVWVSDNSVLGFVLSSPLLGPRLRAVLALADVMSPVCLYAMAVADGDFWRLANLQVGGGVLKKDIDEVGGDWVHSLGVVRASIDPHQAVSLMSVPLVTLRGFYTAAVDKRLKSARESVSAVLSSWAADCTRAIEADSGASYQPYTAAAKSNSIISGMMFVLDEKLVWATQDFRWFDLVVPEAMRARVVAVFHERLRCCSHMRKRRLMKTRHFWWPEMQADIERFTICEECRRQSDAKYSGDEDDKDAQ